MRECEIEGQGVCPYIHVHTLVEIGLQGFDERSLQFSFTRQEGCGVAYVIMCQHVIALSHQLASAVWLFAKDHSSHSSHQTQTYPRFVASILYFLSNFPNNILSNERYHQYLNRWIAYSCPNNVVCVVYAVILYGKDHDS